LVARQIVTKRLNPCSRRHIFACRKVLLRVGLSFLKDDNMLAGKHFECFDPVQ
jgi:hypothetical protein